MDNHKLPDIPFRQAALYWLKLGFISFGGPAGQISMMHRELVEKNRWIPEHRFLHALNFTMLLPGPEAQQLATYTGWMMHGVRGGLVAGILFVLPSWLLLMLLSWLYLSFGNNGLLQGILYGIKPAVTAIVLFAAWRIGKKTLANPCLKAIALAAFIGIAFFQIAFPWIVLAAALAGFVLARFWPQALLQEGSKAKNETPVEAYATHGWKTPLKIVGIGLLLWLGVFAFLVLWQGWEHTFSQLALFFSKAALVTFGGAYAVLPYVYQGGVEHYQWLTASQMIDGLALGETTPGPLIMVVSFIGFVAAWTQAAADASGATLLLLGMGGATVATFFTFLPSFIFIFAGAPLVEASRQNPKLSAPLTGITAAVVGVIVNLALFFGWYVLWPQGMVHGVLPGLDWLAAMLCALAAVALFVWQWGIIRVILLSALIGVALSFLPLI